MTAPVRVAAVSEWNAGAQVTSHKVSVPAATQAGDTIIAIMALADTGLGTNTAGWTQLFKNGSGDHLLAVFYKTASGSEGGTDVEVMTSVARSSVSHCRVYRGVTGVPVVNAVVTGSTAAPNPGNLTPGWGAVDWESIAIASWDGTDDVSTYPGSYTDGAMERRTTSVAVASAVRAVATASEDPGAYALTAAALWQAITVGVQGLAVPPRSWATIIG